MIFSPGGSISTGQPLTVTWNSTGSFINTLGYDTFTGSILEVVAASGETTFIPPEGISTVSLNLINDVGPNVCSAQVTASNSVPYIFPTTTTGSEDDPQIDGTLSGYDLNP